jgi:serine phosphatase RsbU (regulator of sigma subunit)
MPATEICERIRDRVRRFEDGEEATDDLTVMAIRYLG